MRHLRSLAIAAVVLMISAAVVFAGGGPAWKTVNPEVKASPSPSAAPAVVPSASPSVAPAVVPSASPADPSASPDAAAAEAESEEAENHGKEVSEAAHSGPPPGTEGEYRNHGEYVSSIARGNHGQSKKTDPTATSRSKGSQPDDDEDDD